MIVTRANLRHTGWEKFIHDITLDDINITNEQKANANYIVFVENKTALVLKNRY
jgi:hypothetical protein